MTPGKLIELIVKGDRRKLCKALVPLSEEQRESLAETAHATYRKIDELWSNFASDKIKKEDIDDPKTVQLMEAMSREKYAVWYVPCEMAGLAVLALCDRRQIDKLKPIRSGWDLSTHNMAPDVLEVLDARRPKWLAAWVAAQAKTLEPAEFFWPVERGLIRSGALPANESDDYVVRMALGAPWIASKDLNFQVRQENLERIAEALGQWLLADPGMLEHEVWRLFEVETPAFDLTNSPWLEALAELSAAGHLDRRRLLEASARGMALLFRPSALAGYARMHEALKPTLDEREALVEDYLNLLAVDTPVVVGNALKALEELAKAKRLAPLAFLHACPPVFRLAKKTPPSKAIKVAQRLVKQDASCKAAAAQAVAGGLGSTFPDVQQEALDSWNHCKKSFRRRCAARCRSGPTTSPRPCGRVWRSSRNPAERRTRRRRSHRPVKQVMPSSKPPLNRSRRSFVNHRA